MVQLQSTAKLISDTQGLAEGGTSGDSSCATSHLDKQEADTSATAPTPPLSTNGTLG